MTQSINLPAIAYYPIARFLNQQMCLPHLHVRSIAQIDPAHLKDSGITGVVADSDNTLKSPYQYNLHPSVQFAVRHYQEVFGDRFVIMSNDAGSSDDPHYQRADTYEDCLRIPVLRHGTKKPSGHHAVRKILGDTSKIAVFGDRIFTDIVLAHRMSSLAVLVDPFTSVGDNAPAAAIRSRERLLLQRLRDNGINPPPHPFVAQIASFTCA
jgi:phosphatidylglycerophosphatase GEP4